VRWLESQRFLKANKKDDVKKTFTSGSGGFAGFSSFDKSGSTKLKLRGSR